LVAALAAACGHAQPGTPSGTGAGAGTGSSAKTVREEIEGSGADEGGEKKPDPDELRIAAIERAMNALAPVANQCWAAAAAGDFHVAGDVKMMITFDDAGRASAQAEEDTAKSPVLVDCLTRVLDAYTWPKDVMASQAIEMPFSFTAPHGQNTIDRRLVPKAGQAGAQVQVLLDEKNSGNAAASMFEVDLDPGASLPMARGARDEAWVFLDPATIAGPDGKKLAVAALDAVYLPKGSVRAVAAPDGAAARVVVVAVPGGAEGAARAGALPDASDHGKGRGPELHPKTKAKRYPLPGGAATILVEGAPHAASTEILELDAGQKIPTHEHEHETELLYVLGGSGTMTVDGVDMPVGPTTVVQIPPATPHSFVAAEAVTAIQLYAPPGPEQRFKKMK
jgi:quercetin dioxygenase-like cupin family protein